MEQSIGTQIGGLMLGAVPTIVLLLVLYGLYLLLVHKPLQKILDERRALTEGAMEEAQAGVLAAGQKAQEYEKRLRAARQAIFHKQEEQRQQARLFREQALAEARKKAEEQVRAARGELQQQVSETKSKLAADAALLAANIARTVTAPGTRGGSAAGQLS